MRYRGKSVKRQALNNGVFRLQKVKKRRNAAEIANNIAALEILQIKFHNIWQNSCFKSNSGLPLKNTFFLLMSWSKSQKYYNFHEVLRFCFMIFLG